MLIVCGYDRNGEKCWWGGGGDRNYTGVSVKNCNFFKDKHRGRYDLRRWQSVPVFNDTHTSSSKTAWFLQLSTGGPPHYGPGWAGEEVRN